MPLLIKSNTIDASFVFLSASICFKLIEKYRDTINNRCRVIEYMKKKGKKNDESTSKSC